MLRNTDVEIYKIDGTPIYVKREDQCAPKGAPPFSKIRGLMKVLTKLKEQGYTHIGYTETSVSMAGWGVAWGCKQLGLTAVIYEPIYKNGPKDLLGFHRKKWEEHGALIVPIKAGMAKVNYHICKKMMKDEYGDKGKHLPLGLPFEETIEETAKITTRELQKAEEPYGSIVISVGSGTICAGVIRAFFGYKDRQRPAVYGIMSRTGSVPDKTLTILKKAQVTQGGMFPQILYVRDMGYEYTERSKVDCPFPCHPWYDLKAWEWLLAHYNEIPKPILFWNIGRMV